MGATAKEDETPRAKQTASEGKDERSSSLGWPVEFPSIFPSSAEPCIRQPDSIWSLGAELNRLADDPNEALDILGCFPELHPAPLPLAAEAPLVQPPKMRDAEPEQKLYLEDHHVVLKELGCATPGTRLFKDHTRALFPRSTAFHMDELIALQNQCFRCRHPNTRAFPLSVKFYVSLTNASKHPRWTTDVAAIRYGGKKDIAFVPASEECIRHEISFNGGRSPQDRVQSKAAKKQDKAPHSARRFNESSLLNLNENLKKTCDQWIQESSDPFDRAYRQKMVEQFWQDFHKEEKLLDGNALVSGALLTDGYDQTRQSAHNKLVVHIANELGNAMVDWYETQRGGQKKKPAGKSNAKSANL